MLGSDKLIRDENGVSILRVASNSLTSRLAGAIAGLVRVEGSVNAQAIGAGSVNQAIKAAAIARGYLLLDGINAVVIPSFKDIEIDGREVTALVLLIEPR